MMPMSWNSVGKEPLLKQKVLVCSVVIALGIVAGIPPRATASEVKIFRADNRKVFLEGELDGISLDRLGRLRLADRFDAVATVEEPFLMTAAALPGGGWVVGTGSAGRVLQVAADGTVTPRLEAAEPEIFAVWADPDGTVFAGSSPDGKVYRIPPGGEGEVFFDPGERYIWALTRDTQGRLLVATGTEGKLYAVDAAGQGTVILDSHDTHLRSLAALPDGGVLVGTAGEGLVLRVDAHGAVRTLYDAVQPEILALTPAADGAGYYAAAVASEASRVDLAGSAATASAGSGNGGSGGGGKGPGDSGGTVTVETGFAGAGSRPSGFSGGRSEVLRISPQGVVESLWTFQEETVYSLLWQEDRLWIGTGQDGGLYTFRDGGLVLEKDTEEAQIVALVESGGTLAFATTNAAALYRATGENERTGSYQSSVLDTEKLGRFGTFRWRGQKPKGTQLNVSLRSGLSKEPDETWSPWSAPSSAESLDLAALPPGRYVQWKADFTSNNGGSPRIDAVELSYRQQNLRPLFKSVEVLDPGQILVPNNFNPSSQTFEPAHPNREGIFTTLQPASANETRLKPLWKLGYRSLRWQAEDPNGDPLRYTLYVQLGTDGAHDEDWLKMAEDLDDDHYSFDATALPDGVYRFRLVASDHRSNAPQEALTVEEITAPVTIDHTPAALISAEGTGGRVEVRLADGASPLREVVYSVDTGEWLPVEAADGLVDSPQETVVLKPPAGARLLLLRVTDAAHNVRTFNLSGELP